MPSLSTGAGATDRVDTATITTWPPAWTIWMWIYLTSIAASQRFFQNIGCDYEIAYEQTTGRFNAFLSRNAGSNYWGLNVDGTSWAAWGGLVNQWLFLVNVGDTTSATPNDTDQKYFLGNLTVPPAEPSAYVLQDRGAGAIDAATTNRFWNNGATNLPMTGYGWRAGLLSRKLSSSDVLSLWARTRARKLSPSLGDIFLYDFGMNGSGVVPDLSGNGRHGTITGSVPTNEAVPVLGGRVSRFAIRHPPVRLLFH